MAEAKRIYHLMIKENKFVSFLRRGTFWKKKTENMFSVLLSIRKSLGELEKAVETLTCRLMFPQYFSGILPNFDSGFCNSIGTRYMFSASSDHVFSGKLFRVKTDNFFLTTTVKVKRDNRNWKER